MSKQAYVEPVVFGYGKPPSGHRRRTLKKDSHRRTLPQDLESFMQHKPHNKSELLNERDYGLIAGLLATGLRANEINHLFRFQFNEEDSRLENIVTEKHSLPRTIPLVTSDTSKISPFTSRLIQWIKKVPGSEDRIFPCARYGNIDWSTPLSSRRIEILVKEYTGLYPHFLRAIAATYYAKAFGRDAWTLSKFMGWARVESSRDYVQPIEDLEERIRRT